MLIFRYALYVPAQPTVVLETRAQHPAFNNTIVEEDLSPTEERQARGRSASLSGNAEMTAKDRSASGAATRVAVRRAEADAQRTEREVHHQPVGATKIAPCPSTKAEAEPRKQKEPHPRTQHTRVAGCQPVEEKQNGHQVRALLPGEELAHALRQESAASNASNVGGNGGRLLGERGASSSTLLQDEDTPPHSLVVEPTRCRQYKAAAEGNALGSGGCQRKISSLSGILR